MSIENTFSEVVCYWVCTNPVCSEYGVNKDGYILDVGNLVCRCGVCEQVCQQQALP